MSTKLVTLDSFCAIGAKLRKLRAEKRQARDEYNRIVDMAGDMGAHMNEHYGSAYTIRRCEDEINALEREAAKLCEELCDD